MNFDELFEECAAEPQNNLPTPEAYSFSQHIINEVEAEYTGKNTELIDRKKEILQLQKEIEHDKESIKRIKLPKGLGTARARELASKQANEKREMLRNKIKRAECRLDEIDVETNGQLTKEKEAAAKKAEESQKETLNVNRQKNERMFGPDAWSNLNPYSDI